MVRSELPKTRSGPSHLSFYWFGSKQESFQKHHYLSEASDQWPDPTKAPPKSLPVFGNKLEVASKNWKWLMETPQGHAEACRVGCLSLLACRVCQERLPAPPEVAWPTAVEVGCSTAKFRNLWVRYFIQESKNNSWLKLQFPLLVLYCHVQNLKAYSCPRILQS